jgi:hypothetical protein
MNGNKFVGDVSFKWTSKNKKETQELWTEITKFIFWNICN